MAPLVIPTPRLELILQTPADVLAWVDSLPPDVRAQVSPDWIARVHSTTAGDYWALSYTIRERATGQSVGNCAFKGPPDAEGMVEVAYGIDESQQRKGYATEATQALTAFAFASEQVKRVRAHTHLDGLASQRVLTKCGFQLLGEINDPEDGLVYRWERGPN
jgi:RimJ/RimL family protein N-acetyltransferase